MIRLKIGILDYDLGNQDSLLYSLKSFGFNAYVSWKPQVLLDSDLIVLPGVGAFPEAMDILKKRGLDDFIFEWVKSNKPIIGICLGMQLLCSKSYEFEETRGLDLIKGEIVEIKNTNWHIGWNDNYFLIDDNIFNGLKKDQFYFNHKFKYVGEEKFIIGETKSLGETIPSIIKSGNIIGFQFHPEKSQLAGKEILQKIIKKLING
tara:strand:+ start:4542 stop:5156 length:615 start_codon:yes stop_codon:yes gene_type:complete